MPTDSNTCSQLLKGLIAGILHKPKLLRRDRKTMSRPMSQDGIDSVVGKRGSLNVPNCKSFLVTEAERKHVRRRARFQQHGDASCYQVHAPSPPQGKTTKETHTILTETLGEHAPPYATVKNQVAQIKSGDFSTCDALRPGRPNTVTTPEIIDQIHELIFEDHRISAKSIAEQLDISRERVGSIVHEDSPPSGLRNA